MPDCEMCWLYWLYCEIVYWVEVQIFTNRKYAENRVKAVLRERYEKIGLYSH